MEIENSEKINEAVVEETLKEGNVPVEEQSPVQEDSASLTVEEEKKEQIQKRWYVIQTYSGQEDRVRLGIDQSVEMLGLKNKITKVLVPEEDVVELHGKKRVEKKKKMFPGYVFLEMELDDESWYAIRQTPGVARFIGTKIKPTPVSDREMQRVLKQIGVKGEKLEVAFEKGEVVRVISGPFRGYTGTIDEINFDREKLKVLINIFGRDTPVEVNFEHAEKIH